jgi:hypothetical protein
MALNAAAPSFDPWAGTATLRTDAPEFTPYFDGGDTSLHSPFEEFEDSDHKVQDWAFATLVSEHFMPCCLSFDKFEEILWAGFGDGRVGAYTTPGLNKYVKYRSAYDSVFRVEGLAGCVVSLTSSCFRIHTRGGVPLATASLPHHSNTALRTFVFDHSSNGFILGGDTSIITKIDAATMRPERTASASSPGVVKLVASGRSLAAGGTDGSLTLFDTRSLYAPKSPTIGP